MKHFRSTRIRSLFPALAIVTGILAATLLLDAGIPDIDIGDPPQGLFYEEWQEIYLGEGKVGYSRDAFTRKGKRIFSHNLMSMRLSRGPIEVSLESEQKTVETVSGEAIFFQMKMRMGSLPITVEGEIQGGNLLVSTSQAGNLEKKEYSWSKGALMAWGLTRETILRGLEAGTEYELPLFSPDAKLDGPISTRVKVGEIENVSIRGEYTEARKVTSTMDLGIGSFDSISWLNDEGRALKTVLPMGGMALTLYASDESSALADFVPADLFGFTLLSLSKRIPEDAQAVTFSIKFKEPLETPFSWPEYYTQSIVDSDLKGAQIMVRQANHEALGENIDGEAENENLADFLTGNANMNIEDKKLITLASKAAGKSASPLEQADSMRRFASRYISKKSLSVGFATASEVARNPAGDCTEHAVFLAALGRINGVPSRLAVGLAYLPAFQGKQNILGFHMWTQFYLNGQWVDFDAALGESETSPTRIAFYTGTLDENSLFDMALPFMRLMGNLEVEIASMTL